MEALGAGLRGARRGSPLFGAVLLLTALGCSSSLAPERDDLDEASARWEAEGPADYRYEYRRVCFCLPLHALVEVRDGEVVAATDLETDAEVPPEELASFPTVDELFATLEEWITRRPHEMRVTYDAELGYPRSAFFDFQFNVADEEQGFDATGLEALPAPALQIELPPVIVR